MSREAASNSVIRISPLSAWGEGGRLSWHEVGGRPPGWASHWEGRPELEPWWEMSGPHVPLTLRYGWAHLPFLTYLSV